MQRRHGIAENAGASSQSGLFAVIERQRNRGEDAIAADELRQGERDAVAIRNVSDARADGEDCALVVHQDVDDRVLVDVDAVS